MKNHNITFTQSQNNVKKIPIECVNFSENTDFGKIGKPFLWENVAMETDEHCNSEHDVFHNGHELWCRFIKIYIEMENKNMYDSV